MSEGAYLSLTSRTIPQLLPRFSIHHLILEHGFYTAELDIDDVWLISNGTCMPRSVNVRTSRGRDGAYSH